MPNPLNGNLQMKIPKHLAIIMDGNGRWAQGHGRPRHFGHKKGVESVKKVVNIARDFGIEYLTLFSFSTENWTRPEAEVHELFKLLKLFIRKDLAELHQNKVRVKVIGERKNLPKDILELLQEAEYLTKNNTAQTLVIAFNYGARQEIIKAVKTIGSKIQSGDITPDDIDAAMISRNLDTCGIPDPDLILRTAGEQRLSNFLLWQAAYAEFVFVDRLWPEFSDQDFVAVIEEYSRRKRKFGGLTPDHQQENLTIGTHR